MFCQHCGVKIEENTKFCHHCGAKTNSNTLQLKKEGAKKNIETQGSSINNERETVEEYLSKTNIKNKEEAKKYLNQFRILLWTVFISMVFVRGLNESAPEGSLMFGIIYLGLLIYLIIFCVKILSVEKQPKINAIWCIIFAPLSWLYLYPLIADPLKIIIGQKQEKKPKIITYTTLIVQNAPKNSDIII
ncbi:MAG: zinc ribbon domain-containing protein [Patescibacteria group bacterium]|nr:zinc ribbon domain-containing protein [Patescibacteria group bacterium]